MVQGPFDFQKFGKDGAEVALSSFSAFSKGSQAIAIEVADYTKASFELGTATLEKLLAAKSLEQAVEIQQGYMKASYEAAVAESTKLGELYSSLAKDAYKPYESAFKAQA
ncbi:phasin family protein [Xanthobacteraceae bacterium A53D]